jgi:hypothetical protein
MQQRAGAEACRHGRPHTCLGRRSPPHAAPCALRPPLSCVARAAALLTQPRDEQLLVLRETDPAGAAARRGAARGSPVQARAGPQPLPSPASPHSPAALRAQLDTLKRRAAAIASAAGPAAGLAAGASPGPLPSLAPRAAAPVASSTAAELVVDGHCLEAVLAGGWGKGGGGGGGAKRRGAGWLGGCGRGWGAEAGGPPDLPSALAELCSHCSSVVVRAGRGGETA